MSLLALQRDFRRELTSAASPATQSPATQSPDTQSADGRMAAGLKVYHNAYRVQLGDCLAETYPHTHAWLGDEAFAISAKMHIETWPPTGWTLGAYGARFADVLAQCFPDDPEVAELARLEWMLSRAFESSDGAALPVETIAGVDWDRAGLCFVPSFQAMPTFTNAAAIWSALANGDFPPDAAGLPQAGFLLVWRQDFTPCFRTVESIEHAAIELLVAGGGFAAMCELLIDARGETDGIALAGTMLGQWFRDGLIAQVRPLLPNH